MLITEKLSAVPNWVEEEKKTIKTKIINETPVKSIHNQIITLQKTDQRSSIPSGLSMVIILRETNIS